MAGTLIADISLRLRLRVSLYFSSFSTFARVSGFFSHMLTVCVSILSCFSAFNFSFIQPFPDFTHLLFLTWKHPPTWCCCNYFPLQVVTAPQDMIVLCQHANAALICFFLMLPLLPLKWNLGSRVTSVLPQTKHTVEDQMFCVMKINL